MKRLCVILVCVLCLQFPGHLAAQQSPGTITTFAGSGPAELGKGGFEGDGGPATQARLNRPFGIAVGTSGDIYVADLDNLRIRRIASGGIITTFAGGGTETPPSMPPPGSPGVITLRDDGGPAVQAYLGRPFGVATDRKGNVYIASDRQRIRRVDTNGIITTFAGSGSTGFSGDNGPAIYASFRNPNGIAADTEGNVYIADTFNHVVRRVSPDGVITTIAGTGPPTAFTGVVEGGFSGDGGPAIKARLKEPMGLAVGPDRSIYIADKGNHVIRRVGPDGIISTFAGNGTSGFSGDAGSTIRAQLNNPQGVTVDAKGNVYIADTDNHRIRRVGLDGVITTIVGIGYYSFFGDGGPAAKATLNWPSGMVVDLSGNIYIADQGTNRIRRVEGEGGIIAPSTPSELNTVIVNVQVQREASAPIRDLEVAFSRSISGRRAEFEWKGTTDENGKATVRITAKDEPSFRRGGASGYYRVRLSAGGIVVSEWTSIPLRGGRVINLLLPAGQQAAIVGPFFGTPIQAAGKPTDAPSTLTVLSGIEPLAPAVSFGATDLKTGGKLHVPVRIAGAKDLSAGDLILTYDPALLIFRGGRMGGIDLAVEKAEPGRVILSFQGLTPAEQVGMTLWFDRRARDAMGNLRLTGLLYDQNILPIVEVEFETWLSGDTPAHYALFQNSPNPFNPATQIRYALPQAGQVRLTIYNALGQVVVRLVDGRQEAGTYIVTWDAREMASGIYYYHLEAGIFKETRRMVFLK